MRYLVLIYYRMWDADGCGLPRFEAQLPVLNFAAIQIPCAQIQICDCSLTVTLPLPCPLHTKGAANRFQS